MVEVENYFFPREKYEKYIVYLGILLHIRSFTDQLYTKYYGFISSTSREPLSKNQRLLVLD